MHELEPAINLAMYFTYAAMEESTESESNAEEDPEEHANEIM